MADADIGAFPSRIADLSRTKGTSPDYSATRNELLLFRDLYFFDRIYIAGAAFVGFLSHLLLDASGNLDVLATFMGRVEKKTPVLKLTSGSWFPTAAIYLTLLALGWMIAKDFYPELAIHAGL